MSVRRTLTTDALMRAVDFQADINFSDVKDRTFWEGLPGEVRKALETWGERLLAEEIPRLLLSDYTEFSRNGNRVNFETKFFRRRTMLTGLTLSACVTEHPAFRERVLVRIADLLWAILEETTWCLPAHNSYVRDAKQLAIPDESRPVIDLFAAETAEIVGLTELLLRPWFARTAAVPDTKGADGENTVGTDLSALSDRVDREIERRILRPYLSYHFWWMGDGRQPMCNWTPWITQNVLLALFTRRKGCFNEEDLKKALAQAAASVDYYLDDYGEDGCCNEGAFYYGHSGLCLFGCYDVMNRITNGGMRGVWRQPLVENIASYIVKMYVGGGRYINYSDASPFAGRRDARDFLFGKYTGNEGYASFAAADFCAQTVDERLMPQEQNLYYHLLQLAHWKEMENYPVTAVRPADVWYESVGLMVARDARWILAAKAGDNGDSHNHNDIGSVTLYLDGAPFFIDLGVETYTAKTFSDRRYEIWTMQSAYHNTVNFRESAAESNAPTILQREGKERAASAVRCLLCEAEASLSMEMAKAYGEPGVKHCLRSVTLEKGTEKAVVAADDGEAKESAAERKGASGRVVIRDEIDADGLCGVLTFMTYEKPEIERLSGAADDETQIRIGALGTLRASGISHAAVERCPITDARLQTAWKHDCYRILLSMKGTESQIVVGAAEYI